MPDFTTNRNPHPVKIAHLVYGLSLGGIETMLVNVANEQSRHASIVVIAINDLIHPDLVFRFNQDVKVILINRPVGSKSPIHLLRLRSALWHSKAHIYHFHDSSIWNFLFPRPNPNKCCVTLHSLCNSSKSSSQLHRFPHIFSISDAVRASIESEKRLHSKVIPNGIPVDSFRRQTGSPGQVFRLVQIGRLIHTVKGQDLFIKALSLLKKSGVQNFSADIIGDGPSLAYLQNLVAELGLTEHVHFLGPRNQAYIMANLCQYDLLVQPSIVEGFGLTIAEAMAAKIHVLVSEIAGPFELIEFGKLGYSFPSGSIEGCFQEIQKLLRAGRDHKMIEDAFNKVCSMYDCKLTAHRYLNEYSNILNGGVESAHKSPADRLKTASTDPQEA